MIRLAAKTAARSPSAWKGFLDGKQERAAPGLVVYGSGAI